MNHNKVIQINVNICKYTQIYHPNRIPDQSFSLAPCLSLSIYVHRCKREVRLTAPPPLSLVNKRLQAGLGPAACGFGRTTLGMASAEAARLWVWLGLACQWVGLGWARPPLWEEGR